MGSNAALYDQDFYTWTQEQAALLREGAWQDLDVTNLAEEIESLGKSDRRALGSHLRNLVLHLLKWHYQPAGRDDRPLLALQYPQCPRRDHRLLLEDSPSLRRECRDCSRAGIRSPGRMPPTKPACPSPRSPRPARGRQSRSWMRTSGRRRSRAMTTRLLTGWSLIRHGNVTMPAAVLEGQLREPRTLW